MTAFGKTFQSLTLLSRRRGSGPAAFASVVHGMQVLCRNGNFIFYR